MRHVIFVIHIKPYMYLNSRIHLHFLEHSLLVDTQNDIFTLLSSPLQPFSKEVEAEAEAIQKIGLEAEADPEANFTASTSLIVTNISVQRNSLSFPDFIAFDHVQIFCIFTLFVICIT